MAAFVAKAVNACLRDENNQETPQPQPGTMSQWYKKCHFSVLAVLEVGSAVAVPFERDELVDVRAGNAILGSERLVMLNDEERYKMHNNETKSAFNSNIKAKL